MELLHRHLAQAEARNELAMVDYFRRILLDDKRESDIIEKRKVAAENVAFLDEDF